MVIKSEEIKQQLIKSLPLYERKSKLIGDILTATANYFSKLEEKQLQNERELFIDTAIEALKIHAKDLDISLGGALTIQQQRELITAYFRASFEQTTDETIKTVAQSFTGGSVKITQTEKPGIYEIKFIDVLGVPDNVPGLRDALETIIPAHLEFIFAYSYLLIRDVSKMTLNELEEITLDKFAGGKN